MVILWRVEYNFFGYIGFRVFRRIDLLPPLQEVFSYLDVEFWAL